MKVYRFLMLSLKCLQLILALLVVTQQANR